MGTLLPSAASRRAEREEEQVEPVRIGLVGYGFGGRVFHAPLLASAAGCDFLGVVTR